MYAVQLLTLGEQVFAGLPFPLHGLILLQCVGQLCKVRIWSPPLAHLTFPIIACDLLGNVDTHAL